MNWIAESKKQKFKIGDYEVVSQHPDVPKDDARQISVTKYLPQFIRFWRDLERVTGHRWKCTSYLRDSPSHRVGHAFDLAPDFSEQGAQLYAVTHNSDPVLYKRRKLIRQLQSLTNIDYSGDGSNKLGVFIEPDHLHLQVLSPIVKTPGIGTTPTPIVKWEIPKPIYADTEERMSLPTYI